MRGLDCASAAGEVWLMSGELEAAGALTTAALAAGVIEGREPGGAREGACLNCAATLTGAYCSACGQGARAHRSLLHMAEEVLHGLFHFETKAWRTLPMLAFRPGTLTRGYIYGKRARYISPLALFLFTIFLMFFVFAFVDAPVEIGGTPEQQRAAAVVAVTQARSGLAEVERELVQKLAASAPTDARPPGLEVGLARQAVALARAEVSRRQAEVDRIDGVPTTVEQGSTAAGEGPLFGGGSTWQDNLREAVRTGRVKVNSGFPRLDAQILHSLENPDLALYKIQQAAYKFSFLLAPISLPFVWLLFLWKRGLTLYDHVVFVLYSLAFVSVLFVVTVLAAQTPWTQWLAGFLIGVGLPAHTYFHLKGAYALSWWSALWRTLFMLAFALVALAIFLLSIILLGLTG